MRTVIAALCISVMPTVAPAWIAENGLVVERSAGGFTVPYRGLSGARDFWCAAGDYVVRSLGLPPDTKIYRTSSPPRRSGQGISFSLSPENAKRPGIILFSGERGVTAAHARGFCNILRLERGS